MEYNRKQTSLEPIDILKFDTVKTGAVFKQYDINTSILELELVANGEPVHLKDEKVYVTVKSSNSLSTQLLSKYSEASVKEKDNYKVLLRAKKSRRRDVNNIIDVYISSLALENSGEMIAEVMIIDLIKEERITSQSFTFEIKPSITPNRPSESAYKLVKDLDGTYITDAEDVQLLVAEVEPNFKLSFVGARVNEILEKANNFDVEDNTNKIHALQEKDVELESKISNLEKKDSSLDGEIASLKSSDQSIEEEVQGLKTKDESIESEISQLKLKDTSIDGEIDKLKSADETIKSDINSKYEELKQKTDSTNNEIVRLKAQDTTLSESIRTNKGLIDVINPKVTTLEQGNQNVKNRVSVLEGDMNLAKSNISSLQSSNTELSQKVEGVEQGNASIDKILKQLQSDVERYKSSIELLESKVPVWKDFKGESFKVENSFYGKSRGMIIKGKTLQNLFTTSVNNLALSDVSLDGNTFIVNPVNNRYPSMYDKNGKYKENTNYTVILDILENTLQSTSTSMTLIFGNAKTESVLGSTIYRFDVSNGKKGRFIQNVKTIPDFSILTRNLGLKMYMGNNYTGGKLKFNIMVIETSMLSTKQIPSYFSGIKSFGEAEQEGYKYKISILSHGINKLNLKQEFISDFAGVTTLKDNIININYNKPFEVCLNKNNPIKLSKGTNSISFLTNIISGEGILIKITPANDSKRILFQGNSSSTFNLDSEKYVSVYIVRQGSSGNVNISNLILNEGDLTKYEPYKCDKKDILLQGLGFDGGLRSLNDTVYDELNDIKNVAIKRIGKHIFTGNETIRQLENSTKALIVLVENIKGVDSKHFISNSNIGYEARWNVNEWENNYPIAFNFKDSGAGSMSLLISKSKIPSVTDIDSLKQYLRENNIELYYQLKEPIETPLNKDINFDTLDDITYVLLENNIKSELSCQCQVSLASSKA